MSDLNFNVPVWGFSPLKYTPQMPYQTQPQAGGLGSPISPASHFNGPMNSAPNAGVDTSQNGPQYNVSSKWQFGLNPQHIAMSQSVQAIGAFLRQNNERRDFQSYNRVQQNPLSQIPVSGNTSQQALYGMPAFLSGGFYDNMSGLYPSPQMVKKEGGPTSGKAKEMLRDGTAQGHKLTGKQKRYFGWIAGGKKKLGGYADGGDMDDESNEENQEDFEDMQDRLAKLEGQANAPKPEAEEDTPSEPTAAEETQDERRPADSWSQFLDEKDQPQPEDKDDEEETEPTDETPIPFGPRASSNATPPATPDLSGDPVLGAFKRGIANVENAGYFTPNKDSSAFGKYQFINATREGVRQQFFPDIKKADFDYAYKNDPEFQEKVMDKYGSHLLTKYANPEQAAVAFFLGEGKSSYVNQPNYRPTPNNASVGQYLKGFEKGFQQKFASGGPSGPGDKLFSGLEGSRKLYPGQTDDNQRLNQLDLLTNVLNKGADPKFARMLAGQDELGHKLAASAMIFNQNPDYINMNPKQKLDRFFNTTSGDPDVSAYKERWGKYAGLNSNITPDTDVQSLAKNFKEGGEYELTDVQVKQLQKFGFQIEKI